MYKLALGLEYVGTNYSGWQSQENAPEVATIQAQVEMALSAVANHPVTVVCAGRTDAGVHAYGQVVHCEVQALRSMHAWVMGCNTYLPRDIRVVWAQEVPQDFDARKSAIYRKYKYILFNNKIRHSLMSNYMAWEFLPLEVEKMHTAAQSWLGEHDFSSFRGSGCQSKSPTRELQAITVGRIGELVIFDIMANAFLYHMVRNMVGALLQIGSGKRPISWAGELLQAKDRSKSGVTAPAEGLYLAEVGYPERFNIPSTKADLWFFKQG